MGDNGGTGNDIEEMFMKQVLLFSALLMLMTLAGCNTMQGLGKDIEKVGAKIEKAAR